MYRAREPKLDREVAIKVLPADMAQDPERLARFEREARLLASLNHSNIAHVYGFEAAVLPDGSTAHFLAMELVEGEDLSDRLKRGGIPVDEAIAIVDSSGLIVTTNRAWNNLVSRNSGRPAAGADLQDFERALRQRNALLRQEGPLVDRAALDSWDDRLADAGGRVYANRRRSVLALAPRLAATYRSVSVKEEVLRLSYEPSWLDGAETRVEAQAALVRALQDARRADLDRRTTTVGPHRDDPGFLIGDRDGRTHASQGEQRSLVLAVRLAGYDLIHEEFGEAPLLLLDDVFSELDPERRAHLVRRIAILPQAFVTTTTLDDLDPGLRSVGTTWSVTATPDGTAHRARGDG